MNHWKGKLFGEPGVGESLRKKIHLSFERDLAEIFETSFATNYSSSFT